MKQVPPGSPVFVSTIVAIEGGVSRGLASMGFARGPARFIIAFDNREDYSSIMREMDSVFHRRSLKRISLSLSLN